jgi:hypothetical protein
MDYAKYDSVEKVVAYVSSLPLTSKSVLDVPWKRRGVDVERVQQILDSKVSAVSHTTSTPTTPRVASAATPITPRAASSAVTPTTSRAATAATPTTPRAASAVDSSAVTPTTSRAATAPTRRSSRAASAPSTPRTSIADSDATPDCHVLVPFSKMVDWISSSMSCKHCKVNIKASCISKTTVGIATQLHYDCDSEKCRSRKKNTMEAEYVETDIEDNQDKRALHSTTRFAANWRMLAANQLFGESQKAGEIVAGFLDLSPHAFPKWWFKMEDQLAEQGHERLASEIIEQNLKDYVENKIPETGILKVPLTVSFDMGWQKRGRSYNSLSGHAFLYDVHTGKVVGMQVYSKNCLKCSKYKRQGLTGENIPDHRCPKNYEGSSKGMEATAALQMVKRLFEHELVQAYVKEMVIDDDASTRALLSHCLSELAEFVAGYQWPVDSNGKKVPKAKDIGKLPFDHPIIIFLADLMHRIRCFGKYVFAMAVAPLSTSTCTMVDAYRLKRNFGYWLLSYHTKDFDTFQQKSKAVVEHHFNNHAHCDDWCSMKKADATQTAIGNLKYRCKINDKKMYEDMCKVLHRFTESAKLKECHHGYSSQKNESMNQLISRYVPKDKTFCQSMSLNSRICLAVGVDSVGHEEYYERLFEKMKIPFPDNTRIMLRSMKKKRDYDRNYQAQPTQKRKRSVKKFDSTKDRLKKQMADKALGVAYRSGMNMEPNSNDEPGENTKVKKGCIACGAMDHRTRRAKACKYSRWSEQDFREEIVRITVSKATEEVAGVATAVEDSGVQSEGTYAFFGVRCDVDNMQFNQYSNYARFLHRGIRQ